MGGALAKVAGNLIKPAMDTVKGAVAALPKPGIEYQDMTPADSKALSYAASHNQQVLGPINPAQIIQGRTSPIADIIPGMVPKEYPNPAARLKGDFNTVTQMAEDGLLKRKPKANPNDPTIIQTPRFVLR
jgi:hypothetical protein